MFNIERIGQSHLRQKKMCSSPTNLVGEEEEKTEKIYKFKVSHRFQIQHFSTFKDGRLTSNLGF